MAKVKFEVPDEILVQAKGSVLYIGKNPIMILGLKLMGRKCSYLGRGAHEYDLHPQYVHLLNTEPFFKAMAKLGIKVTDWDAQIRGED